MVVTVPVLTPDRSAHVRAGLVAGIANTYFRIVDRCPLLNDGVNIGHRRRVIYQHVKCGVRVEKVLNDDCIPMLPHTGDVVALLGVVVILQ